MPAKALSSSALLTVALMLVFASTPLRAGQPTTAEAQRATQHYKAGWDHLRAEAFSEAIKEFESAVALDDRFAHAYYGLGKAHMGLKQYVAAAQAYERCHALYEQSTSERTNLQYAANDQRRDQIMILRDALRSYQQMPPGQQNSTQAQLAMNELSEQIRQLEAQNRQGSLVDPSARIPAFVSLALGSAYFRSNRMDVAEKMYREAIAAKPDYGEAHNNLAVIYLLSGRLDDAEKHVKLAEKGKFKVHPDLKEEIRKAKQKTE